MPFITKATCFLFVSLSAALLKVLALGNSQISESFLFPTLLRRSFATSVITRIKLESSAEAATVGTCCAISKETIEDPLSVAGAS